MSEGFKVITNTETNVGLGVEGATQPLNESLIKECKLKLLKMKAELLNRSRQARQEFAMNNKNIGDETDQAVAHQAEHSMLIAQERIRQQMLEIEFALGRIENGSFGICEETQEPIEIQRLLAIPYTRLSIEGAELREESERKFARF